jgi:putative membrane protein
VGVVGVQFLMPRGIFVLAGLLLATEPALAHDGTRTPGLWVTALLAISLASYALGLAALWRHAGAGRGVSYGRAACFIGGWLVLAAALVSPLDSLGRQLFAAHMVQHTLLMTAAAPLLVLGRPLAAWAWALPRSARRSTGAALRRPAWRAIWRRITAPMSAWLLHATVLWLWHVPSCFDAAMVRPALHALQHTSFLAGALLFWWSVLGPSARAAPGAALASLFTTLLHTGALGALIALSSNVWYAPYIDTAVTRGWNALEDQQVGGLVMWAPAGVAYIAAGLSLVWSALGRVAPGAWPPEPRLGA